MSISTTSDALLAYEIASPLCRAQRRTRVACFYKQQHDQHAHQMMHDYTLSERDILKKLQYLAISASPPHSSMESPDRDLGSAGRSVSGLAAAGSYDWQIDKSPNSNS